MNEFYMFKTSTCLYKSFSNAVHVKIMFSGLWGTKHAENASFLVEVYFPAAKNAEFFVFWFPKVQK